jgi:hypothetical protein
MHLFKGTHILLVFHIALLIIIIYSSYYLNIKIYTYDAETNLCFLYAKSKELTKYIYLKDTRYML